MNPIGMMKNMSPVAQISTLLLGGGASLTGILAVAGFGKLALLIFVVMAFVAMLLMIFKLVLKKADKAKGKKLDRAVKEQASAAPAGALDAASRARMDDLRKSWEEGIVKFRERGKDLYSVPWYLMVGESGSGKTEAIRHCNVGFPPGLQDKLQGSGGTMNMHWWFTNQSVIIDTAGRLLQDSGRQEWRQFLKMMRKARQMRPINGLLLVIPADSLIKDSGDDLEKKGGRIASALDEIQEELGVRFPVYVVVTKCDLINGFREYFDAMPDPELKLQEQMLGWSNPQGLDEQFSPAVVDQHLKSVRDRLVQRRYQLLLDPVHTEDSGRRRIEQVDALYSFPDTLVSLAPRLRRYLEMVFVAGEWSRKPLFIRGIYFTSSMQEGAALDAELAEALGVKVADLQQEQVAARREKTFFLRDVFVAKVFKEHGLVTAAGNVKKSQGAQRTILMAAGFGAAVLALGLTAWSYFTLQNAIGRSSDFWKQTATKVEPDFSTVAIVGERTRTSEYATFEYYGASTIEALGTSSNIALADLPAYTQRFAETEGNQRVPLIFKPVAMFTGGDPFAGQKVAHAAVFEGVALYPLVDAVRTKIMVEAGSESVAARTWSDEATAALGQLIRIEAATVDSGAIALARGAAALTPPAGATPAPAPGTAPARPSNAAVRGAGSAALSGLGATEGTGGVPTVGPLVRYAIEGVGLPPEVTQESLAEHISSLDQVGAWTYSGDGGGRNWQDVAEFLADERHAVAIRTGTNRFVASWNSRSTGADSDQLLKLQRLRDAMIAFDAAERALWAPLSMRDARTLDEYGQALNEWTRLYGEVETANASLALALADLGAGSLNLAEMATRAQEQVLASARASYTSLLSEIPGGTEAAPILTPQIHPLLHEVEQQLRGGYSGIEARVAQEIAGIQSSLQTLEDPLLRRIGSTQTGEYAFARRFAMYKAANDQLDDAGAIGALPPDLTVFELKASLDRVDGGVAEARAVVAAAVRDAPAGDTRFASGATACGYAIDASSRKRWYDGISSALANLDDAGAMEDMVSRHAEGSGVSPVLLRGLPMTSWTGDTQAESSFSPPSAKAAFDAVAAAGTMAGGSEDPSTVRVIEIERVRGLVDRANNVMKGYGANYVAYWTVDVPGNLSVRPLNSWSAFLEGIRGVDARQAGDRISANSDIMKAALEAVPGGLLEARDQTAVTAGLATASFEREFTNSGNPYRNATRDLRDNFQSLSDDFAGARTAVLNYSVSDFEEDYLSIFYLPEGEPEERVRYWSSMTFAGFSSLANESNRGARQALVSLKSVRRAFPLCRDASTTLSAGDLPALLAEVDLVGAAAVGRTPGGGAQTTIGGNARVGDDAMDEVLDDLRGRGIITPELRPWFDGVRLLTAAMRPDAAGGGLTFEFVVLSAEQQTQQDQAQGTNSVDLAGIYPYVDVMRGGSRQRWANDNAGGVLSRVANSCPGLPVPSPQSVELWFYRQAQQVAGQPPEQRGVQKVGMGGDAWTALRMIASPGAEAVSPAGNAAQEWRVPVSLPNPQNGAMLQYWIGIKFNRAVPLPATWPTTGTWPAAD